MFQTLNSDLDHYRRYCRSQDAAWIFILRTIYCHPAFIGVIWFRFGQFANRIKIPLLARLLKGVYYLTFPVARLYSGVQIPLSAQISPGLAILHFGSVVIAGGTRIGPDCLLHHNVNLVAYRNSCGPDIGARFYAGVGVTVIDNITIEDDVSAGAGAVITRSVPKDALVAGVPARIIRFRNTWEQPSENSTRAKEMKWLSCHEAAPVKSGPTPSTCVKKS